MNLSDRIGLLAELGDYLRSPAPEAGLEAVVHLSHLENQWFTPENTWQALRAIANNFLEKGKLKAWAEIHHDEIGAKPETQNPKTIGMIMAGNIPLVGFQDWLCVFVSGHRAKVKLSDKDKRMLPFLVKKMGEWAHESWSYTEFLGENDKLSGFDAVIATGSNNSARYFEHYFSKYPHIIRRNRNSVAVLDGSESGEDFLALGRDIFSYFGLGCRNVSKLYVPEGYQFDQLLESLHDEFQNLAMHSKYKNNFDYNFTLFILNKISFLNNGCLLLREDKSLAARIASVHFEHYSSPEKLAEELAARRDEIQCVVGKMPIPGTEVLPFGKSQEPGLSDYPDGVDVMRFLASIG